MRRLLLIPLIAVGVAILSCEQQAPQAPDDVAGIQLARSAGDADRNGNNCVCRSEREWQGGGKKAAPKRTPHYRDDVCTEDNGDVECECAPGYEPRPVGTGPEPPSACDDLFLP